jgi:twitching motility protein PilT
MAELMEYLANCVHMGASDLFIVPGGQISYKLDGCLKSMGEERLTADGSREMLNCLYALAKRDMGQLQNTWDDDFSFAVPGLARFRVSAYRQRGSLAAVIRMVAFDIPDWEKLHIPKQVMELSQLSSGMVLISGIAGCGKSTTMACIVDRINRERACHVITVEDPIEYLHRDIKSIISQREIGTDTVDYLSALRACLRQAPDVIQLGEMRDAETVSTAMTAAETGHLLLTTLHTKGAVNTIDRIIDTFPAQQQEQIRVQLGSVLHTVVSQQLLPDVDGERIPAFEILHVNSAVRSMIRDCKTHQIAAVIASGSAEGMVSMDQSILELYRRGKITQETAIKYSDNHTQMLRLIEKR